MNGSTSTKPKPTISATMSRRRLGLAGERTELARDAYTYLHVVIVAGIIVSAVGDEWIIANPAEHLHGADLITIVVGPAIYLLSLVLLRQRMTGSAGRKRLIAVIVAEQIAGRRRAARGEPAPREKLEVTAA